MNPIKSSTIKGADYDDATKTLTIEFKNGGTYQYKDVPRTIHSELLFASSAGKYFHANIRNTYPGTKVKEQPDGGNIQS